MLDRWELLKLKIQNLDNSFSALLKWKLLCWLKNSTTKNQMQEKLRTINLWWSEDQFYSKISLIDLHPRRKNWSSTTRNLTWRWHQKVTSQIQKKSTKFSKVIKRDCWDLNWNIWIRFVKLRFKSLKRRELLVIPKQLKDIKKDIIKLSLL